MAPQYDIYVSFLPGDTSVEAYKNWIEHEGQILA
jgi:hypothetical protein